MNSKYLVAIVIPEPWQKQLRRLQQQYKPERWRIRIEPHITLIPPGDSLVEPVQAARMFADLKISGEPAVIIVKGIGQFSHSSSSTVFCAIESSPALTSLQLQLAETVGTLMQTDPKHRKFFRPHITLSNKLLPSQASRVKRALTGEGVNFEFKCRRVWLFKKSSADPSWERLVSLKLARVGE